MRTATKLLDLIITHTQKNNNNKINKFARAVHFFAHFFAVV